MSDLGVMIEADQVNLIANLRQNCRGFVVRFQNNIIDDTDVRNIIGQITEHDWEPFFTQCFEAKKMYTKFKDIQKTLMDVTEEYLTDQELNVFVNPCRGMHGRVGYTENLEAAGPVDNDADGINELNANDNPTFICGYNIEKTVLRIISADINSLLDNGTGYVNAMYLISQACVGLDGGWIPGFYPTLLEYTLPTTVNANYTTGGNDRMINRLVWDFKRNRIFYSNHYTRYIERI